MKCKTESVAKILLVEDSLPEILLAKRRLERENIHADIMSVRDGDEALEYLLNENNPLPDLVLLDINMPSMDGRETLKTIKKHSYLRKIPIVIYSGSEARKDIEETRALGVLHYIVKPISYEKLKHAIADIDTLAFDNDHALIRQEKQHHGTISTK